MYIYIYIHLYISIYTCVCMYLIYLSIILTPYSLYGRISHSSPSASQVLCQVDLQQDLKSGSFPTETKKWMGIFFS